MANKGAEDGKNVWPKTNRNGHPHLIHHGFQVGSRRSGYRSERVTLQYLVERADK